jgi:hypothetical protein
VTEKIFDQQKDSSLPGGIHPVLDAVIKEDRTAWIEALTELGIPQNMSDVEADEDEELYRQLFPTSKMLDGPEPIKVAMIHFFRGQVVTQMNYSIWKQVYIDDLEGRGDRAMAAMRLIAQLEEGNADFRSALDVVRFRNIINLSVNGEIVTDDESVSIDSNTLMHILELAINAKKVSPESIRVDYTHELGRTTVSVTNVGGTERIDPDKLGIGENSIFSPGVTKRSSKMARMTSTGKGLSAVAQDVCFRLGGEITLVSTYFDGEKWRALEFKMGRGDFDGEGNLNEHFARKQAEISDNPDISQVQTTFILSF